jgi:hypothetical protein
MVLRFVSVAALCLAAAPGFATPPKGAFVAPDAPPPKAAPRAPATAAPTAREATSAEIQGTWVFDLEASLAWTGATMKLPPSALDSMRTALAANKGTTYVFSGTRIEVTGSQAGASNGTFVVEGRDLIIKDGGRESRLQVGLKSPTELVLSMMGVGQVFTKR